MVDIWTQSVLSLFVSSSKEEVISLNGFEIERESWKNRASIGGKSEGVGRVRPVKYSLNSQTNSKRGQINAPHSLPAILFIDDRLRTLSVRRGIHIFVHTPWLSYQMRAFVRKEAADAEQVQQEMPKIRIIFLAFD